MSSHVTCPGHHNKCPLTGGVAVWQLVILTEDSRMIFPASDHTQVRGSQAPGPGPRWSGLSPGTGRRLSSPPSQPRSRGQCPECPRDWRTGR